MRVHLVADPPGIGRITTAAGTVVAVDIVESHPDLRVVDLTGNAADARHADAITRAVARSRAPGYTTSATATCRSYAPARGLPDQEGGLPVTSKGPAGYRAPGGRAGGRGPGRLQGFRCW